MPVWDSSGESRFKRKGNAFRCHAGANSKLKDAARTDISGSIKRAIHRGVNTLGFEVSRLSRHSSKPETPLLEALLNVRETASDAVPFLKYCVSKMDEAHAQLCQDLLVLFLLDGKRDGYFVEFGAMDGIILSNTFLLESKYSWRGIAAEPARCWHQGLRRNRTCSLDHRCVQSLARCCNLLKRQTPNFPPSRHFQNRTIMRIIEKKATDILLRRSAFETFSERIMPPEASIIFQSIRKARSLQS